MRPIDADALKRGIEVICKDERASISAVTYFALMAFINKAPTIEAEAVKRGRWLHNDMILNRQKCSECGFYSDDLQSDNYCPNCGAKMDGGAD